MIDRVFILGTGLLGTSVGLALRAAGFRGSIAGWNRSPEQAQTALAMGALDSIASDPLESARMTDVLLIAVPILATLDWMEKLAPVLSPDQLVTDVGSTKREIAAAASRLYNQPGRAAFLPGHPMAGKEKGGAALADAQLFRGAVWLFTPAAGAKGTVAKGTGFSPYDDRPESSSSLVAKGTGFSPYDDRPENEGALAPEGISARASDLISDWRRWVAGFGPKIIDLDPARHDELVAWVSHLPQFVATALSALLEDQVGNAPELKDIGGRALREMTRLGASPYSMWRDIALTNAEPIDAVLHALEQRIAHLRENLRTPGLREEFERANRFRRE
jgi:prephenate dehydrogenase